VMVARLLKVSPHLCGLECYVAHCEQHGTQPRRCVSEGCSNIAQPGANGGSRCLACYNRAKLQPSNPIAAAAKASCKQCRAALSGRRGHHPGYCSMECAEQDGRVRQQPLCQPLRCGRAGRPPVQGLLQQTARCVGEAVLVGTINHVNA
jgi:hypothetical protein